MLRKNTKVKHGNLWYFLINLHSNNDSSMKGITDYICNDYKPIDSKETVEAVRDFFSEVTFSHFPVVEESMPAGLSPGVQGKQAVISQIPVRGATPVDWFS